jgi:LacI family transcriptional regulator
MKGPTIRDVAKLAGLSVGTVSGYINGKKVSEQSRNRVEEAIKSVSYTPYPSARRLASGKSFSVLLYIMVEHPIAPSTWLHELPIIQGINDVSMDTGYIMEMEIQSNTAYELNFNNLEGRTRNNSVDGIILLSPWEIDKKIINMLNQKDFPYLMVGSGSTVCQTNSIDFENYEPIYEIIKHQYKLGHWNMGMIAGFKSQLHTQSREKGFRTAMRDMGVACKEENIRYGDYSLASGFYLMNKLMENKDMLTTVVCCNDYIAAGAIKAIKTKGLTVPGDISVSGFDDTVVSEATEPTITTVKVPSYEMGVKAMHELLLKMKNPDYRISTTVIPSKIVFRDSTGSYKG